MERLGKLPLEQGSLHYTPEHCLVIAGFQLYFGVEKAIASNGLQNGFILRRPVEFYLLSGVDVTSK